MVEYTGNDPNFSFPFLPNSEYLTATDFAKSFLIMLYESFVVVTPGCCTIGYLKRKAEHSNADRVSHVSIRRYLES